MGVRGQMLNCKGRVQIPLNFLHATGSTTLRVETYVIEEAHFPGDVLIGHNTMCKEQIELLPPEGGVRIKKHIY